MFNKMVNEAIASKAELINHYDRCKLQAHSAFMQGDQARASMLYRSAFAMNKSLILHYSIESSSLTRCVHACLDCLDFSLRESEQAVLYYLQETETLLAGIIGGCKNKVLRYEALLSYAEIIKASIVFRQQACCDNTDMQVLMSRLETVWKSNACLIKTQ
jgi:hypothetical protein